MDEQERWNRSAMERRVEALERERDEAREDAKTWDTSRRLWREKAEAAEARLATVEAALAKAADWFGQYGESREMNGDISKATWFFECAWECRQALAPEGLKP
jgi:hypothetical protein